MARRIKLLFVLSLFLVLFQDQLFSQIQVEVVDNAEDMVGRRLVYHVKEKFRKSEMFNLPIAPKGLRFRILIYTMDRFKGDNWLSNISTMYSVIWLLYDDERMLFPIYLKSTLGFAGSDVVESAAEGIVANTDKVVSEFEELLREIEKILKPNEK
ncbi:hypothetical protein [Candidatus Kryptobacter tengchongensis]|nr:hypothetical protein [Candidatus Kryptobacter tengchongensis]